MTEQRLGDLNALAEELSSLTMTITGLRAEKGVLRELLMEYRKSVLRIVDDAPTIEAEPVVRCKDCVCISMWNDALVCSRIAGVMDGYYHGTIDVVNPDDYCSHGIRQRVIPCDTRIDGGDHG